MCFVLALTGCASKKQQADQIPFETKSQALFKEDGIWYRSYPDKTCGQHVVVKVIVPNSEIDTTKKDSDFTLDAAELVAEYCEQHIDDEVKVVKLYLYQQTSNTPYQTATLHKNGFSWEPSKEVIDDDTTFDDLNILQRQAGLITAGLKRSDYRLKDRSCKAYLTWFSNFGNYGVSPYSIDQLKSSANYQELIDNKTLPLEMANAITKINTFPEELIKPEIFQKFFVNKFVSLTQNEKNEFFFGAMSCHKLNELAKGKVEISLNSSPQQCAALTKWMDALPSFDLAYARNYQDRLFPYSFVFSEHYFNRAYYPRYLSFHPEQRLALAQHIKNCQMENPDSVWSDWRIANKVKWGVISKILEDSVLYIAPMTEKYPYEWQQEREEKRWQLEDKALRTTAQAHKAVILYWEYKYRMIRALESAIDHPELFDPEAFNEVFNLAQWGYSPRHIILDQEHTFDAEHLLSDAKETLAAFLDQHSEFVVSTALEQIFQALPKDFTERYEQTESISLSKNDSLPTPFSLVAGLLELQENLQSATDDLNTRNNISELIQIAISNVISPLITIDMSQLQSFPPGIEGIELSQTWLEKFLSRYQRFSIEPKVANATQTLIQIREAVVSRGLEAVTLRLANLHSSSAIAYLKTRLLSGLDSQTVAGQTLTSRLEDRFHVLMIAEQGSSPTAHALSELQRYYTDFEISQLSDKGHFFTEMNAPFPSEETLVKTLYRTMQSQWLSAGHILKIDNKNTFSMSVLSEGFTIILDFEVAKLDILSCEKLSKNKFECDYRLEYTTLPRFEDAPLNMSKHEYSWLVDGTKLELQSGRQFDLKHIFQFTESGWSSDDMSDFIREEYKAMRKISIAWEPIKNTRSCLSYKNLSFACQ